MNPAAWKLASKFLETCCSMKRNIKHRRTQDHTRFLVLLLFCGRTQCLQWQKAVVSSVSLKTSAQSARPDHTNGKTTPARSQLTPREVSCSWKRYWAGCFAWGAVRQRGDSASSDGCASQLDTAEAQTYVRVNQIPQERTGIFPCSNWQSLAIFCNRLATTIWNFLSC